MNILFDFYFYFFPAKVWMQEVAHEYWAKTRGMSEEKKKELQNNLLETFGHLLEIDQMAQSPVSKLKTVNKFLLKTVGLTFFCFFNILFPFQATAFSGEKDIHVAGLVFYSGSDLQARAMGVTVVTDDELVKSFINAVEIPFNKHLTDLSDMLRLVFFFFALVLSGLYYYF